MKRYLLLGFTIAGVVLGGSTELSKRHELCNKGLTAIPGVNQACKAWATPGALHRGGLIGGAVGLGLGAIACMAIDRDREFDPRLGAWIGLAALATHGLLSTVPPVTAVSVVSTTVNSTVNVDPELRAFADVIGHAEGTKDRYDLLMGFGTFTDFSKHPDICVGFFNPATQKPDCSTGAGRYQYITTTWNEKAKKAGVTGFSKEAQDTVLFFHLNELGIPQLLKQGRFEDALARAAPVWVSLYPNSSKQRVAPFEELKAVYNKSLGSYK